LKGHGAFNAQNALAATAVAGYFNLDLKSLSESWHILPTIQNRFQVESLEAQNIVVIDDSYNANPFSFKQAAQSFAKLTPNKRKLIVVGDMLELGESARIYHEDLGRHLAELGINFLLGVGPLSRMTLRAFTQANPEGRTFHFQNALAAGRFLVSMIEEGDAVFIKGSHGMRLDQIKPLLVQAIETAAVI
jgi:UDP-N-acetylmuramoyl-tripeptide--D-alanyl-D-alanine ligase